MRSADDIESVAMAIHASDYPLREWKHVNAEHRTKWRAMARTCISVSQWGDYVDAAKRLAHWDDVDNKRGFQPFAEKTAQTQRVWLKRAEAGFAAIEKRPAPRRQTEPFNVGTV